MKFQASGHAMEHQGCCTLVSTLQPQVGGIAAWSEHVLLSESILSQIDQQLRPENKPCLAFIRDWRDRHELRVQYQSLVDLMDARFPPVNMVSASAREAYMRQSVENTIAAFSQCYESDDASRPEEKLSTQDYLWCIVQKLEPKEHALDPSSRQALFARASWVLFLQNIGDEPRYTPHGYCHSLEVARWMMRITRLEPKAFQAFCQTYHLRPQQAEALVMLCGLLHDCGYPYLGGAGATKATHAIIGGAMFYKIIQPVLMKVLQASGVRQASQLCRLIARAIHLHSSDIPSDTVSRPIQVSTASGALFQVRSVEQLEGLGGQLARYGDRIHRVKTTATDPQTLQDIRQHIPSIAELMPVTRELARARSLDALSAGDKALATPCLTVRQSQIPLAFWLMLADNLEISHRRLGEVQSSPVYGALVFQRHQSKACERTPERLKRLAQALYQKHPFGPSPSALLLHAASTQPSDLPYLIGALAIGKIELVKLPNEQLKIVVSIRQLPQWLMQRISVCPNLWESRYLAVSRLHGAIKTLRPSPQLEVWEHGARFGISSSDDLQQVMQRSVITAQLGGVSNDDGYTTIDNPKLFSQINPPTDQTA